MSLRKNAYIQECGQNKKYTVMCDTASADDLMYIQVHGQQSTVCP